MDRTTSLLLLCVPIFVSATLHAGEPSLAGHWKGTIELPNGTLELDLDFAQGEDGAWQGDISIPVQKIEDRPLNDISAEGLQVAFAIEGIPGNPTFKGELSEDGAAIGGDFTQGGQTFAFTVNRTDKPSAKAKTALAGIGELVERALDGFLVPGLAMAVVVDGEVVHAQGYGYRDLESKEPVTARSIFAIGSATKAFTTAVLGSLVDEGALDWDRPVIHYLPDFRLADNHATHHLTVRDLVTHRSGLPRHDFMWYNSPASREDLFSRLQYLEPDHDLRETFHYQNLMYLTAGYLAERLTGTSWEDNVRQRIFAPLGMDDANFSVKDSQAAADFAMPYDEEDGELKKIPFRDITTVGPAGSINAHVTDMTRWVMLHLGKGLASEARVLEPATLREMHTPQTILGGYPENQHRFLVTYGLGWFVESYRGHYRVHHGGNIDGFSALVSMLPFDGVGVVILVNKNGSAVPGLLTNHVMDAILGLEPVDWIGEAEVERKKALEAGKKAREEKKADRVAGTSPSRPLEDFAGTYTHQGYGDITVSFEDGRLYLSYNRIKTLLEHRHYDVFEGAKDQEDPAFELFTFSFVGNAKGDIESLHVPFEFSVSDIVFKKQPDRRLFDPEYLSRFVGDYALPTQIMSIELRGDTLFAVFTGQPPYALAPDKGLEFNLKEISGFSVAFVESEDGEVTGLLLKQPNGNFAAERKKAEQ